MKKIHYKLQLVITLLLLGLSMPFLVQAQSSCPSFKDDFTDGAGYSDSEFNVEPSAERRAHIQESLSALGYSNSTNENRNLTQNKLLAELSSSGTENNTELTEEEISRLRELLPTEFECSSNPDSPTDFFGDTPLHDAASSGDLYVATFLIECGANPDYQNDLGWTALHHAAYWGHVDVAELLLDEGASLDIQTNIMGWTALHMAAVMGDIDMAELLLDEGADPYTTAGFFKRKTARDFALDANEIDMLKLFDDRGIEDLSYVEKLFH